jgi:ATP-binding cassette subfamily B protein
LSRRRNPPPFLRRKRVERGSQAQLLAASGVWDNQGHMPHNAAAQADDDNEDDDEE